MKFKKHDTIQTDSNTGWAEEHKNRKLIITNITEKGYNIKAIDTKLKLEGVWFPAYLEDYATKIEVKYND